MSDTTAPERIWLQLGDEPTTYNDAVNNGYEVSWCADQIYVFDLPYVRADLYEQLQAENERLIETLRIIAHEEFSEPEDAQDYAAEVLDKTLPPGEENE